MLPELRRNVHNWFLCGVLLGAAIGCVSLTVWAAHASVLAASDFRAYPVFVLAIVVGGAGYLLKRDGHPLRRRYASGYCFISKERKARVEDLV